MRLLILFIPLLISQIGNGQIINASPPYRVTATSCSYLLNQYSSGYAAYSLRRVNCNYASNCIRVRRSSDNTESDIGFSGVQVDTASLKTFIGTGGTDNGYVVTWYDQSGNARNATNATSSEQPAIILAGVVQRQNSLPSLYFDGDDALSSSFSLAQPSTHFMVAKNGGTNDKHMVDGNAGNRQLVGVSGGNLVIFAGSLLSFGANSTNFNLYSSIFDGTSSSITRNGAGTVTGNAGTAPLGATAFIGGITGARFTGYMSELILFNVSKSSDRANIESAINSYYSIY